jgi:hypothetical protein
MVVEYGEDELADAKPGAEPLIGEVLADGIELHGSRRILKRLIRTARSQ